MEYCIIRVQLDWNKWLNKFTQILTKQLSFNLQWPSLLFFLFVCRFINNLVQYIKKQKIRITTV